MIKEIGLGVEALSKICQDSSIKTIFKIFKSSGFEIRVVGGAVRDAILNRPINDVDFATNSNPNETIKLLNLAGLKAFEAGKGHGTITTVINKVNFEITTLRKDVNCNGRHAEVQFTSSWQEDAARRDFTVNAMSFDGYEIFDYFSGMEHVESDVKIRFIGNAKQRIEEDFLRILRYFRFIAEIGGDFNDVDLGACCELKSKLKTLSKERVTIEFFKLVMGSNAQEVLQKINEIGALSEILTSPIKPLKLNCNLGGLARVASVFGSGFPFEDFSLSNLEKKKINFIINAKISDYQIKKMLEHNDRNLVLEALKFHYASNDEINLAENFTPPKFPISGNDFRKYEGKEVGQMIEKAREFWRQRNYLPGKDEILQAIIEK